MEVYVEEYENNKQNQKKIIIAKYILLRTQNNIIAAATIYWYCEQYSIDCKQKISTASTHNNFTSIMKFINTYSKKITKMAKNL